MDADEARDAARRFARDFVVASVTPYEAATRIWKEIVDHLESPVADDLWRFKSNASAIEDFLRNAEESGAQHDRLIPECTNGIVAAARDLIDQS